MQVLLEPLSTGDIIDRSIRLYRQNVRALLLVAAGPFLFGAASWLAVQLGYGMLLGAGAGSPMIGAGAFVLFLLGGLCWLAYLFVMVFVYAGIARVIGDHLMLGTPVTARAIWAVVRSRAGDLAVTALLLGVAAIAILFVLGTVFLVAMMLIGFAFAAIMWLRLPEWAAGLAFVLVMLLALGAIVLVLLPITLSRVIFVPQVVIIEGASAASALSRSFVLGGRSWTRVLAILLFTNCTAFSLVMAFMLPILLSLWLGGYLEGDSLALIDSIYGGVGQFASFLLVPVWAISYTLMYFDNRVRKEGYDVELLVRKLPQPPKPVREVGVSPWPAFAAAGPQVADGRCPRCGHFMLTGMGACSACGWRGAA